MSIEVYAFEDVQGTQFGDWTTQDIAEARAYAAEHHLRIIAHVYEWAESEMAEDFTDGPTCPECEQARMYEDDHVWICSNCSYETSEPQDDAEDVAQMVKEEQ
jgi:ribosomal protein L37AE/L43A